VGRPAAFTAFLTRVGGAPVFRYLVLSGQLAAVLYVIRWWYKLEGLFFEKFAVLLWVGFTIHYFLPARARLPFFGLLSAAGILLIFGPVQGTWLLGLGLVVIGLCHLPIPFAARLAIVTASGVLLCVMRLGKLSVPWSAALWPTFGSMFALRIIIYLYDLRHGTAPFSFWRSMAYFFMLPNTCFPLFPVVDYQTFCRTHDDDDRSRICQTGLDWMVRGTVHLILYRLIYQHLPIDTTSVVDIPHLLRYLLWPFLLYLQVSGLFHLVVGMLHLFGFNLPETHHLFYLASSFTDFWRRINIYWKDFMMKVFYFPAYFRLRKLGNNTALVLGTFAVFFATWVLHSWQWFWLRGSFLLKGSDLLFWCILAVLVAVSVVLESNRPMKRTLSARAVPWQESMRKAFQALAVFVFICILWSLWISDSIVDWFSLFSVLGKASAHDLWLVPVVVGFAAAFVVVALYYERRKARAFGFYRHAFVSGGMLFLLLFVGWPDTYTQLDPEVATVIGKLKTPGLNSRDAARRQRGYYEKLNDIGWDDPGLAKVYQVVPDDWGSIRYRPDLAKFNAGLPYLELLPNAQGRHRGALVQFNRWGMRDRDYPLEPEPGSYRIALLGASHTFGSGVAQVENFESRVEERLNHEDQLDPYQRVEILNFATEGYSALDVLASLEQKIFAFKPHAVLYVVHQLDAHFAVQRLSKVLDQNGPLQYPELIEFARKRGVGPGTQELVATRALEPGSAELLAWAYGQIADRCRTHAAVPLMAYLPILTQNTYDLPVPTLLAIGREAGFLTLDLSGVYNGYDPEKLQIAPWDEHPNVTGHQLVAERLYGALRGVEASLWRKDENGGDQVPSPSLHSEGVPAGRGS
jgi:D-alanyl-lipoteichoic acid acyltransferase DltB (MBOAT superfamily)